MKRFVSLGLKSAVAILSLYLYGLVALGTKTILVEAVPAVAEHRANAELVRRSVQFDSTTEGAGQMAMSSCVIDRSWASFVSAEQAKALTEPDFDHTGWKPICNFETGHVMGNDPLYLCGVLDSWTRMKEKAPANPSDNGPGFYFVCGSRCGGDVEGAGESVCVTHSSDSFRSFVPGSSGGIPGSMPPRNALKTANIRLKVNCSDASISEPHCVATMWVSRERESWGSYLVAEMATALRHQVIGFALLIALALSIPLSTFWRIIVVSERRDPNSLIPWIIEVPLMAAALDHEYTLFLSTLLDRCEDCLGQRLMKWPRLCVVLMQGMPTLLARRFAYLMQRPFVIVAARMANLWH